MEQNNPRIVLVGVGSQEKETQYFLKIASFRSISANFNFKRAKIITDCIILNNKIKTMEFIREINNKTQLRSRYDEVVVSLQSHFTMSKFISIFLVFSSVYTTLLVSQTLEIQHSCQPMFHSGTLPTKCLRATQTDSNSYNKKILNLPKKTSQNTQKNEIDNTLEAPEVKINKAPIPSVTKNQANSVSQSVNGHYDDMVEEVAEIKTPISLAIKQQANSAGQFVNEHSDDIAGGVAGIAAGAATLAAAGVTASMSVPVAGAVAIGLGIWFVIRSVF